MISPHGYTIGTLKEVLTFHNYESKKDWYNYNNIIDVMKKAGYHTYWISNQESSGKWINLISSIANRSDTVIYNQNQIGSSRYDDALSKYKINTNKNFIIYHLIGAHQQYDKRYPKNFTYFKGSDYPNYINKTLNTKEKKILANYDNAIRYNDTAVYDIMKLYKNKNAIVIYFSDHGENVYEKDNSTPDHGDGKLSRYTVEIPFIIYMGDKFKTLHPKLVNRIKKSLNNSYMIDDVIHTLLDIASIKTDDYKATRSIINNDFNKNRKRLINGKDYDKVYKDK